ncbi:helix-turn-helix protein [Herbihabitans rhizosphaerae]|uniref:Helix-turn-helix protein n=1 Tax=Herbihabitans rhizosphaerae TaxID=1872711 RepID=A0A4Q7L7U4_9PSEU|nr:helix-turn-helix transcriptional regulator [Herbihabitans rhizosphaerae]RZS44711.1 helix-turn-helix protein [Herbihabitans rhizosphaerae]
MTEPALPSPLRSGSPALFKRAIALSLRKWRQEAGLTQKAGAQRVDRTIQHISNLESGGSLPAAGDLELLLALYGKNDRIPFMREMLSAAKKSSNWWRQFSGVVPPWFDLFLGLESGAAELFSFDTVIVRGLLQTPGYAKAVIKGNPDLSPEQVDQLVELRMDRQKILDRDDDPVHLWTVMDESVLLRKRGNPEVMREQFEHLLRMSERPRVDIQILPLDADATPSQDGATFTVMKFPPEMDGDPGLVYLEQLTGGRYIEKSDEIAEYRRALSRLQALAASPRASRGIIKRALKEVT